MTLDAEELEAEARQQTGLDDFGDSMFREGLERLVRSFNEEADLTEAGRSCSTCAWSACSRPGCEVEDTYRMHPAIDDEVIEGPVFVIGLPRTGTTALSQLVAADPQFRSLRMWESSSPCPPPESATEHSDPRIADAEAGLAMMYDMFPLMASMHHQEATTATECQDLLGMSFRTVHFDGFGYVPSYLAWVTDCDMRGTYQYHRRVLQLLQWHCPPRLWHLKTPVHMFALDALLEAYPDAKFLWSHRDPAKVLGSVCSLIHYTRSWSSDRDDSSSSAPNNSTAGGRPSHGQWISGAAWRDDRFADLAFADLQVDPVGTWARPSSRSGSASPVPPVMRWRAGPGRTSRAPTASTPMNWRTSGWRQSRCATRFAPYMDSYDAAV